MNDIEEEPTEEAASRKHGPRKPQRTRFHQAFISIASMIALIFTFVVGFDAEPQVPLVFGTLAAGLVAARIGYTWDEMLEGMVQGIVPSLEAILILLLIGMLVGVWIVAGTVPSMIYYGLHLISGRYFLVTTALICLLVSFAIGSWGTLGTVGLAFMGIGLALGVPAPAVAGCIVSGAYCGEIISPLSDATNFAAGVSGNDIFELMKKALPLALSAFATAEAGYLIMGHFFHTAGSAAVASNVESILEGLGSAFNISPICLIPMAVMVACIVFKLPAIPSMLLGIIVGMLVAWGVQSTGMALVIDCAFQGYESSLGNKLLDNLLSAGGMMSMTGSVTIVMIAMAFGGLMTSTGQMDALIGPMVNRIKTEGGMTALVVASCIIMNIVLPDQFLGISVPGQMFGEEYGRRGISHRDLGRALLAGGAVTSPLIPWNTCGIYAASILGIGPARYAPFVLFSLITPIYMVLVGFFHDYRNRHAASAAPREKEQSDVSAR